MTHIDRPDGAKLMVNLQLAHGGGGRAMNDLLARLLPLLPGTPPLHDRHDGFVIEVQAWQRLAFTTDSYVVSPLFFPGGNIGTLAVNGTINDLAMCGARPMVLSCALIIEEGFSEARLEQVMRSMAVAARDSGVEIVTGDTKVVGHGKGDGLYINTSGIGILDPGVHIGPRWIAATDAVLLSGDIGRHAAAIMIARAEMNFSSTILSDTAPLHRMVQDLLTANIEVHCLRDATRGGVASTLIELCESANLGISLQDGAVPVDDRVKVACEILGLDPLYLANEGRFIAIVAAADADKALAIMRRHSAGQAAALIGTVTTKHPGVLVQAGRYGTEQIIPMLTGEQLPRIC